MLCLLSVYQEPGVHWRYDPAYVFYPDGSSASVDPPSRRGEEPWRRVLPWTHRHSESPDLFPESPDSDPALATRDREEMEAIIVPAIAMSSRVVMGCSARWRDEHLLRKPCGESSVAQKCPHSCDCMTFALPGQPISGADFQRLGMWRGLCEMAWDPVHIPLARELGERDGWGVRDV